MRLWIRVSRRVAEAMVWILRDASQEFHMKGGLEKDSVKAKEMRADADELNTASRQVKDSLRGEK